MVLDNVNKIMTYMAFAYRISSRMNVAADSKKSGDKRKISLTLQKRSRIQDSILYCCYSLIWHIIPEDKYPRTKNGKFPEQWQYIFDSIETLAFVTIKTIKIALSTAKSKGNNYNLIRL